MNKYSEKILKYLNKQSSKNKPIEDDTIYNTFDFDKEVINSSLKLLENENKIVKINHIRCSNNIAIGYSCYYSTNIGKDYFKDKFKIKFKNNLFNIFKIVFLDIVRPLLVAYITARITANNAISNNNCCNESNQARNK